MYFKATFRYNTKTGKTDWYYRLVESYRNALDEVRQRTILSVGFLDELTGNQIDQVQQGLNSLLKGQFRLYNHELVDKYIQHIYQRLISEKKIDFQGDSKRDFDLIDLNTVKSKHIREVGAEWLSLQACKQLNIESYLEKCNWDKADILLALNHIISRAVYPASELKTLRFMQENSSICELTGTQPETITKDQLYDISKKLYSEKEGLESFLSKKTNDLFDLQDNIILYDLTNTYFEGEKRSSKLAKYGRSKEKRSDCPLVVLGLVVNTEGFTKYSTIYQGNMADSKTLGDMIEKLRAETSTISKKATVVIDAGIATEKNLAMIVAKGYKYVCVSRSNLKNYIECGTNPVVTVKDKKDRDIELIKVQHQTNTEYYLKVTSPTKAIKERAMNSQFQQRFEDGMIKISESLTKKSGVKRFDKVCERIGRLKQKYSSVHRHYKIDITKNQKDICTSITWKQIPKVATKKIEECGVYFLRTNHKEHDEQLVWTIYNCIRNIESTFRTLKTDLSLRPVFHQSDEATMSHLHLGLLAYWIVNTIRHQLKQNGINSEWREIVRIMNTQKCVTTVMVNSREQHISIRKCSEPELKVREIYGALSYKYAPFIRKKSVVPKMDIKKILLSKYQQLIT